MKNKELFQTFYTAFSNGDANAMTACYHDEVVFEDPTFRKLKGERAKGMWKMLLSKKAESDLTITFKVLNNQQCEWIANYKYGPNKRPVVNKVSASFEFHAWLIGRSQFCCKT